MKNLKLVVLSVALAAAAAPLFAAPHCGSGVTPRLNGDLFSPVDCSTATKPTPLLPGLAAVRAGKEVKTDLRDLDGRWEGNLIQGIGRYELLLTIKTSWNGKTEIILETKELQFQERLTDRLSLVATKPRGSYSAVLTTTLAPGVSLKGEAILGAALAPEAPAGATSMPPPDRQAELTFANGAVHRIHFALKGKNDMRVRAFSGIPGAPLQKFELELKRSKREAL